MKRAWADHREVRDERAELSGVLDAADEIREARVLLVDDRRGSAVGVIDDDVDLVAPQALRGGTGARALHERRHWTDLSDVRRRDVLRVREHVVAYTVEVTDDVRELAVLRLQRVDRGARGELGEVPVQRLDPLAALLLQVLHRFDVLPELLGDRGHRLTGAFLLVGGKPLEFLIGQRLAVSNRRGREAGRRAHQPDVLAARLLLQPLARRAMPVLELLVDLRDAVAVVLALERGGNGFTQLVDETFHVAPQRRPLARRELQRQRLALVVEVVDVAPVRRIADRRRVALQEFLDGGVPVTAGRAEDEDVEAVLTDMHAEVERLERAVLADRDVEVLDLGRRRER